MSDDRNPFGHDNPFIVNGNLSGHETYENNFENEVFRVIKVEPGFPAPVRTVEYGSYVDHNGITHDVTVHLLPVWADRGTPCNIGPTEHRAYISNSGQVWIDPEPDLIQTCRCPHHQGANKVVIIGYEGEYYKRTGIAYCPPCLDRQNKRDWIKLAILSIVLLGLIIGCFIG